MLGPMKEVCRVELHAADGCPIEQFLNGNMNRRADAHGDGLEGRNRFPLELLRAAVSAIDAHRVDIRLSPLGAPRVPAEL